MAWLWKNRTAPRDAVRPVKFNRVIAALAEMGYSLEREADRPVATSLFNGYPVRFHADDEDNCVYFTVNAAAGAVADNQVGRSTWESAVAWANEWNEATFFGTASVLGDKPEDYFLIADVSVPCQMGLIDQQLKDWLDLALTAVLQTCNAYHGIDE